MVDAGRTIILVKGEYDAEETYEFLDVVYLSSTGNSYICKAQSSTGNAPDAAGSQYWQIFCRGTIVDTVLDSESQNPVANATIVEALGDKINALGGDTADAVVSNFEIPQEELPVPESGSTHSTLWGVVTKCLSDMRNLFIRSNGDVSGTVVSTFNTQTNNYPTPAAGNNQSTLWGKVAKYLSDLKNNYCAKANLVDGFTQATAGVNALDAHAGKTLNDSFTDYVYRALENGADLNTITSPGIWGVTNSNHSFTNSPLPSGNLFTITVNKRGSYCIQILTAHNGRAFIRGQSSGGWSVWSELVQSQTFADSERITSSVTNATSKTLTVFNNTVTTRLVAIAHSSNADLQGIYLVNKTRAYPIVPASGATITVSGNDITIANSTGYTCQVLVI